MNRSLGIWVFVLLLTAAGIIAMLTHERNAAAARLAKAQAGQHKLAADLETLRAERDKLRRQLQMQSQAAAELALATASRKPSPAPAKTPPDAGKTSAESPEATRRGSPFAEMMKNPAMKDMMRQQQIAAIDMQYAGLFSRFNLTEEEKADFKQLLAERVQHDAELGFKMFEDITPQQRKALVEEYENSKKAAEARIREFLNNDADYDAFTAWEETKGERIQIDMGRSLFATAGEPLTTEQEEQLIGVMLHVRKESSSVPDLTKPQNFDPANLTQAEIDRQLARYDANAEAIATQSSQFLSPKQTETLRTLQRQWRTMSESGLKMTSAMFGSQGQPVGK